MEKANNAEEAEYSQNDSHQQHYQFDLRGGVQMQGQMGPPVFPRPQA
jgi:hypothetical protein